MGRRKASIARGALVGLLVLGAVAAQPHWQQMLIVAAVVLAVLLFFKYARRRPHQLGGSAGTAPTQRSPSVEPRGVLGPRAPDASRGTRSPTSYRIPETTPGGIGSGA